MEFRIRTDEQLQLAEPIGGSEELKPEVVDLSSFKIEVGVSSEHAARLSALSEAAVTPLGSSRAYRARVRSVGVKADEKSGSFPAILQMENPGPASGLRAGMDVTVSFPTYRSDDAVAVPSVALLREVGLVSVFVVEEGRAWGQMPLPAATAIVGHHGIVVAGLPFDGG